MKRVLKLLGLGLLVLFAVLLARTLLLQAPADNNVDTVETGFDAQRLLGNMQRAIALKTISVEPGNPWDTAPFEAFLDFIGAAYPAFHRATERVMIAQYTPLFIWRGRDQALQPVLLTGHYDVVPVIPGTEEQWSSPPFAGEIRDGYLYGRGALDDKSAVITLLEAAERLAEQGFVPQRTIYISLGHDEEIGGDSGAAGVADYLQQRSVQLAWSLDEGSFLVEGVLPVEHAVAMINVAEKGYMSLDVVASGVGGHSSMPPPKTAVSKLADALVKVQASPFPGGLDGVMGETLDGIAPYLPFEMKFFVANRWLFDGLLEKLLSGSATMNASMRTTIAPTMLSASVKENVLPIEARALVNLRLHPRDTPQGVLAHFESALQGLEDISLEVKRASGASKVASTSAQGYQMIAHTVRQVFGKVIVVPGITVGGTDSKHYGRVADNAYRFNPMRVTQEDVAGFHGTNERISTDNLLRASGFYQLLIQGL